MSHKNLYFEITDIKPLKYCDISLYSQTLDKYNPFYLEDGISRLPPNVRTN
jgi:hypothetical protein